MSVTIGIVLTPRHITKFVAEVIDVNFNDLVLDPACGTGGFLVSAFDRVKKKSSLKEINYFKMNGIYGIEDQDPIIALALVNMIFRGDGKNHMIEGNCFKKWLNVKSERNVVSAEFIGEDNPKRISPITKVMMNPPFAQPSSQDKEYRFIEHALKQMEDDGILFSVLPVSVMIEKSTKQWRRDLLKENTLLSVIVFPQDLFYPTGVHTLGIFVKRGVPHDEKQNVLWIRALHDGFVKKKGKRKRNDKEPDDLAKIKELLKTFIKTSGKIDVKSIPKFVKASPIDSDDKEVEFVPEVYLDDEDLTIDEIRYEVENLIRESVAYLVRTRKEGRLE